MGWATAEIPVQQTDAPELVNTSTAKAFGNTTYYAVYAVKSGETEVSYEDVLTRDVTGITGTNYFSFSGKKVKSDAVYAGNCAGGNNSIQLRSSNNNSGIVSTTSGGKVKKVQVIWNSNTTSGRTLDIYGSNTAYNSASDLYVKSKRGEELGSIVCGTSTELNISGDYDYLGMRSTSGAMYLSKILITWESNVISYSNFCTLVSVPTISVTVSGVGYATLYYRNRALKVPNGVTAKTYKVVEGKLTESKTYSAGEVIPKDEAVVLKGAEGEYTFTATTVEAEKDADNQLRGTDEAEMTTGGNYYYALQASSKDGKHGPGMYWMNSTGSAFENGAHKAYMALQEKFAEAQGLAKEFYLFDDATTGISGIDATETNDHTEMYNLNGQRVGRGYKGVVIKNGKKSLVK